jgi:hypothetical protein
MAKAQELVGDRTVNQDNTLLAAGGHCVTATTEQAAAQIIMLLAGDDGAIDCRVPLESSSFNEAPTVAGNNSAFSLAQTNVSTLNSEIPETWAAMIERQFAGKDYGTNNFGREFQQALLVQIANANRAIEQEAEAAQAGRYCLTADAFNDLIDAYDTLGSPCTTSSYVRPMIIATVREEIGRAYLKALQARGQMLGTSFDSLTRSLTEVPVADSRPAEEGEAAEADSPVGQEVVAIDAAYSVVGPGTITSTCEKSV